MSIKLENLLEICLLVKGLRLFGKNGFFYRNKRFSVFLMLIVRILLYFSVMSDTDLNFLLRYELLVLFSISNFVDLLESTEENFTGF